MSGRKGIPARTATKGFVWLRGTMKMNFFKLLRNFEADQDGAVTVDWVVLTAAVVGLGVAALAAIRSGTATLTSQISSQLAAQSISTTF